VRILGIDPGVAITGWGVVDENDAGSDNGLVMVDFGVVETKAGVDHSLRLVEVFEGISEIVNKFTPDYVAIEKLFFCKNLKTAIVVGEARGVILLAVEKAKVPIKEFTPLQIKEAVCGYGKADKKQVQSMVAAILGMEVIPTPDDAADGLAVAICSMNSVKIDERINLSEND